MGIDRELKDADRGFETIASYPKFRNLPIILSEADPEGCAACSTKVNPADNYRNGVLYPAYTAAAYKGSSNCRINTKWICSRCSAGPFEFENRDYLEGFRSLSTNEIDKPILNLFRMFSLMNGERVTTTSDGKISLDQPCCQRSEGFSGHRCNGHESWS